MCELFSVGVKNEPAIKIVTDFWDNPRISRWSSSFVWDWTRPSRTIFMIHVWDSVNLNLYIKWHLSHMCKQYMFCINNICRLYTSLYWINCLHTEIGQSDIENTFINCYSHSSMYKCNIQMYIDYITALLFYSTNYMVFFH
jgi:hypothetical protein